MWGGGMCNVAPQADSNPAHRADCRCGEDCSRTKTSSNGTSNGTSASASMSANGTVVGGGATGTGNATGTTPAASGTTPNVSPANGTTTRTSIANATINASGINGTAQNATTGAGPPNQPPTPGVGVKYSSQNAGRIVQYDSSKDERRRRAVGIFGSGRNERQAKQRIGSPRQAKERVRKRRQWGWLKPDDAWTPSPGSVAAQRPVEYWCRENVCGECRNEKREGSAGLLESAMLFGAMVFSHSANSTSSSNGARPRRGVSSRKKPPSHLRGRNCATPFQPACAFCPGSPHNNILTSIALLDPESRVSSANDVCVPRAKCYCDGGDFVPDYLCRLSGSETCLQRGCLRIAGRRERAMGSLSRPGWGRVGADGVPLPLRRRLPRRVASNDTNGGTNRTVGSWEKRVGNGGGYCALEDWATTFTRHPETR